MLEIRGLYKTFDSGTFRERRAINGLNLTVSEGEFVTVIGGNGSGKSTLLNLIAGAFPADAGSILLQGMNLTRLPEHQRAGLLGRVFRDPTMGTAESMSIEENLALAHRRGQRRTLRPGLTRQERVELRAQLATLGLGLEDRMSSKVSLLSGGQRQALTLLMATLKKPELLLLDEPTAALDPKTADRFLRLTQEIISREGLTALLVTHDMANAIRYGNRLLMLDAGRIVLDVRDEAKQHMTVQALLSHTGF